MNNRPQANFPKRNPDTLKNILVIIGTRPEAIKMAPVVHALKQYSDEFSTTVCLTGQHREMLHQAITHFNIVHDFDLALMEPGQNLTTLTGRLAAKLQPVFEEAKPDIVLVQGDTTTAFMGALVAYYHQVVVGHIEAGLRTNSKFAPFPEEINRRLASVLTDHHFAPTAGARDALLKERVDPSRIAMVGNTVIDALLFTLNWIQHSPPDLGVLDAILENGNRTVLITGHRRENFGEGFDNICRAIRHSAEQFSCVNFIYPVHLNPQVQKPVYQILGGIANVHLVEPLNYVPFVKLMNAAHVILTDSGGIQEEAPTLEKPVLIMREVTERQEAVEAGAAVLVGCNVEKITSGLASLLTDEDVWKRMTGINNPYGDGQAAYRIVEYLRRL